MPPGTLNSKLKIQHELERIKRRIYADIEAALAAEAATAAERARKRAPKRKAFYGERKQYRFLTSTEFARLPKSVRTGLQESGVSVAPRGFKGSPSRSPQFARTTVKSNVGRRGEPSRALEPVFDLGGEFTGRFKFAPGVREQATSRTIREVERGRNRSPDAKNRSPVVKEFGSGRDTGGGRRAVISGEFGGRLKREIFADDVRRGRERGKFHVDVVSPTPYARYVEFPTSRTAAQPYMRPALDAAKRSLPKTMRRALEKRLR